MIDCSTEVASVRDTVLSKLTNRSPVLDHVNQPRPRGDEYFGHRWPLTGDLCPIDEANQPPSAQWYWTWLNSNTLPQTIQTCTKWEDMTHRVIQSNRTINMRMKANSTFPPNQIDKCQQRKKSTKQYNFCSVL